jgi:hypothetical protein
MTSAESGTDINADFDEIRKRKLEFEAKNPKPAKKSIGEVIKRIKVGAVILSEFLLHQYLGTWWQVLWVVKAMILLGREQIGITYDEKRERASQAYLYQCAIGALIVYTQVPYYFFGYRSLQESGVTKDNYGWLYTIFFEWHVPILILLFSWWFISCTLHVASLKHNDMKYFLAQVGNFALCSYFIKNCAGDMIMITKQGRFWYLYP